MSRKDVRTAERMARLIREEQETSMVRQLRDAGYTLQKIAAICGGRSLTWVTARLRQTEVPTVVQTDKMPDESSRQDDENIMAILNMKE